MTDVGLAALGFATVLFGVAVCDAARGSRTWRDWWDSLR